MIGQLKPEPDAEGAPRLWVMAHDFTAKRFGSPEEVLMIF
jgi:hypothetical protein